MTLLPVVLLLTSLVAIVLGSRFGIRALVAAIGVVLEAVGATVLFFGVNLLVGGALVLVARRLGYATTLYEMADIALLVLSLLQALTFTAWRQSRG